MSVDKAGQYVCLTTLDYAVRGSLMSTHCPSCGLRLIIKHDNIVNRVTSVSLLLGMSMLIGYNLGAHSGWIHQLSNRVFKLFGFGGDRDKGGSGKDRQSKLRQEQIGARSPQSSRQNNGHVHSNGKVGSEDQSALTEEIDETQMSDLTCDSAIDMREGLPLPDDDLDDQLMELLSYNDFYEDLYTNNGSDDSLKEAKDNGDDSPGKRLRTKTVDRIDQVLHQIDDIKKSIVEIDDELYHIAGSTYANFNPDFLTLTNTIVDDFDKEDDFLEPAPHYKLSEDRASLTKVQLEEVSRKLVESMQQEPNNPKSKERNRSQKDTLYQSGNQSHASFSDVDSLQLEWDFDFESGYDYYDAQKTDSETEARDRKQSPLREKLSSAASGLDMPMTDEQKLKNMHDLLDEAKKQGLLNNIIDALDSESSHQYKKAPEQVSTKKPKYSLGKS